MTTTENEKEKEKEAEAGIVTRLADRGGETVHRFADEVAKQPMVSDAIGKANATKDRLDALSRSVLELLGIAPSEEVEKLRKEVARLERRLKKLETGQKPPTTSAKPSEPAPALSKPAPATPPAGAETPS
jgi:TolA-binding protein